MANFFKILAIMDLQIMAKKKPMCQPHKMERLSSVPHTGSAFTESLRGIKHFQGLKKADFHCKIESPIYVS